jgi:hypothetical protein
MKVKAQVTHIGKGTHACETPHLQLAAQQNELLQRRVQDASRRAAQRADQWKWTVHVQMRVEPSEKINARLQTQFQYTGSFYAGLQSISRCTER